MNMNGTIEIMIGTTGEIQIDAVGFKGPDCEKAIEEPLGRGIIAGAVCIAGHDAKGHGGASRFPSGNSIVNDLPVVFSLLRLGIGPVETDVRD